MIKFSMIIPVYNAGDLIEPVFDSIKNQTYSNYEIIFVDDGSTDNSLERCKKFAESNIDLNVKVLSTSHLGICMARTIAMKHASGEWIAFSDHDDSFDYNLFNTMNMYVSQDNVDIIKFSCVVIETRNNSIYSKNVSNLVMERVSTNILLGNEQKYYDFKMSVWTGIYRRSFLEENNIYFDSSMKYGMEDFMFNISCLHKCKEIQFINKALYTHYKRDGISTSSKFNQNRIEAIETVINEETKLFIKFNLSCEQRAIYLSRYISGILNVFTYESCNWDNKQKINYLKKIEPEIIPNKINYIRCFNISKKRFAILLCYKLRLYRLLLWIFDFRAR